MIACREAIGAYRQAPGHKSYWFLLLSFPALNHRHLEKLGFNSPHPAPTPLERWLFVRRAIGIDTKSFELSNSDSDNNGLILEVLIVRVSSSDSPQSLLGPLTSVLFL